MATWKNFEFKMWLKEINASCLSQEKLKLEAMKFSEKFDNVDKKTISKICDDFEKEHKKIWKEASYDIFEEMGGTDGKMRGRKDVPPNNYFPKDQSDLKMIKVEKNMETKCEDCNIKMSSNVEVKAHIKNEHADAIKKAFSKEVMSRVPSQSKYLDWLKKDHIVEIMTPKQSCKLFLTIIMYSASVPCCRCRFATFFFSVKKESLNDRNTVFFDLWSNFTSICLFKYSDLVIFFFGLLDSSFVAISSFVPISSFVATSSSEPSPVIMKPAELLRSPPPCSAWLCILSDALVAAEKSQ